MSRVFEAEQLPVVFGVFGDDHLGMKSPYCSYDHYTKKHQHLSAIQIRPFQLKKYNIIQKSSQTYFLHHMDRYIDVAETCLNLSLERTRVYVVDKTFRVQVHVRHYDNGLNDCSEQTTCFKSINLEF